MSQFKNFSEVREMAEKFGLQADLAMESAWNAGYALGRSRWYWGPRWFSSFRGWINTRRQKLFRK